jgi:hypothetical protein
MSDPLIGPNQPPRIWIPNEDTAPERQPDEMGVRQRESVTTETSHLRSAYIPASPSEEHIADEVDVAMRPVFFVLWVVAVVTLQMAGFVYQPLLPPENLYVFSVWLGVVWSGWGAAIWFSSRWSSRPLLRVIFLIGIFAWHGFMMAVTNNETAARYIVMLGGYALIQSVAFRWAAIPTWRSFVWSVQGKLGQSGPPASGSARRQFGIGDLIAITAMVAILITAAKAYHKWSTDYHWLGLFVGESVLLLVALLSVLGGLARRLALQLALFVSALAVGVGGSMLIEVFENLVGVGNPTSIWPIYAILMVTFSILMFSFAALAAEGFGGAKEQDVN